MPFWKKKKSKQQKSTAKEKPAVGPVKPKQRPSSLCLLYTSDAADD